MAHLRLQPLPPWFVRTFPPSVTLAALLVLPFCAEFCIAKASELIAATSENKQSLGESISGSLVLKFVIAALILGITTGFMRDTYSYHTSDAFGSNYTPLFFAGTVLAVAILLPSAVINKQFSIKTLYRPAILISVLGFALAPSFGLGTAVPYLLITIGYSVFEIVIWATLCDIANRFQFTFLQVFGIGRAITIALGLVMGSLLSRACAGLVASSPNFTVLTAGIAVVAIVASYLYILTEHDLDTYSHSEALQQVVASSKDNTPAPSESTKPRIPLMERCKIIGEYYGLSKREIDVFHLLAIGRKAACIQEELVISPGTVNTHTYHIYTKLGVHSQQELIDLMQNANLDEMAKALAKKA